MVRFKDGEPAEQFYSLIRPPRLYVCPEFIRIHGITADMLTDQPPFNGIWDEMSAFIGNSALVAHNASFDMKVLSSALGYYTLKTPPVPYFCTLALSRAAWPGLPRYKLTSLAGHFGIIYNAHNALDDALTCGKLVSMAMQKTGETTITGLLQKLHVKMKGLSPLPPAGE